LTLEGMGCKAYGVEWAKTIGWPIGQSKVTPNNPTNVQAGVPGPWRVIGTGGAAGTATTLILNKADEVKAQDPSFWKGYWVELSLQTDAQARVGSGPVAAVVARATGAAVKPTDAANGGELTIACPDVPAGCPTGVTRYRLIAKSDNTPITGIQDLESKGERQTSIPASVAIMDSDVYISGHFKGFDRFRFGVEGVDETVGYRSVGDDTWETYLLKLSD